MRKYTNCRPNSIKSCGPWWRARAVSPRAYNNGVFNYLIVIVIFSCLRIVNKNNNTKPTVQNGPQWYFIHHNRSTVSSLHVKTLINSILSHQDYDNGYLSETFGTLLWFSVPPHVQFLCKTNWFKRSDLRTTPHANRLCDLHVSLLGRINENRWRVTTVHVWGSLFSLDLAIRCCNVVVKSFWIQQLINVSTSWVWSFSPYECYYSYYYVCY